MMKLGQLSQSFMQMANRLSEQIEGFKLETKYIECGFNPYD